MCVCVCEQSEKSLMEEGGIYRFRRILIFSVVLMLMENLSISEGAPWCCVDVLANGSANYTLNTTECGDNIWNRGKTPIKDQNGDKDDIVINFGPNWILLHRNYSGVKYMCMDPDNEIHTPIECTDPCESGKSDLRTEVPVLSTKWRAAFISVTIIIIIIVIIAIWKTGCYRRCHGDAANRHEANNANHANGEFQADDQEESGV